MDMKISDRSAYIVLVIEDNPSNMKLVENMLEMSGYSVLKAGDAETGLNIAMERIPDIIIMDIQLPGMDGLTATGLLKKDGTTSHIPVIAITSFAMKGDENRIKDAGCDSYIPKPFDYREFLGVVESFLSKEKDK